MLAPARIGLPEGMITDAAEATKCLLEVSNRANMLAPIAQVPSIPENYRLSLVVIHFFTDGDWLTGDGRPHTQAKKYDKLSNGTWYQTENGKLALHKGALRQLAAAAGLSISTENLSKEANYWVIRAKATIKDLDGGKRFMTATKELDLRPGSTTIETWERQAEESAKRGGYQNKGAGRRVQQSREAGYRMAESKAVNAVIRDILSVQTAYTKTDARKPFVYPKLTWVATTDEAKKMQAAAELGIVEQIYNSQPKKEQRVIIDAEAELVEGEIPVGVKDEDGDYEDWEGQTT